MKLLTLAALSVALGFSQSTDCDTLDKCQEALKTNRQSSLIHFRIGEIYFQQGSVDGQGLQHCAPISTPFLQLPAACYSSYMSAANEFRRSLAGDLEPKWTEVWDHINLGKIFDITQQRDRALNEYRLALRTKDNTRGALDEAKKYTEAPYKRN